MSEVTPKAGPPPEIRLWFYHHGDNEVFRSVDDLEKYQQEYQAYGMVSTLVDKYDYDAVVAERDAFRREAGELHNLGWTWESRMAALTKDRDAALAQARALESALEVYANEANWKSSRTVDGGLCEEWICTRLKYWYGTDRAKEALIEFRDWLAGRGGEK